MVAAVTVEGGERESDFGEVINSVSRRPCESRNPYSVASRSWTVGVDTFNEQ
jgi:hypothetical protein